MYKKGVLYSICHSNCNRCRKGRMFKHSPYSLIRGDFVKMDEHCSVCGYRFCMEPGFFIGAAYVNYAFFIVILLTTYFTGRFFFSKVEALTIFYIVLGLVLSLFPLLFRYSRVVYSYLFSGVKYDPRAAEK